MIAESEGDWTPIWVCTAFNSMGPQVTDVSH